MSNRLQPQCPRLFVGRVWVSIEGGEHAQRGHPRAEYRLVVFRPEIPPSRVVLQHKEWACYASNRRKHRREKHEAIAVNTDISMYNSGGT